MRKFALRLVYFFVFAAIANSHISYGQSIAGDTIFVNKKTVITIKFPSKLISFHTTPNNAPYNLAALPPSDFIISAKSENTKPALLFIKEGNNLHQFILAFKKDINLIPEELFYDYSTQAKLEQRMNELATGKIDKAIPRDDNDSSYNVTAGLDNEGVVKYRMIIEEGEKNLKLGRYDLAKMNFERAQEMIPGDQLTKQRLEEIKIKLYDPVTDSERNKKYIMFTANGIALFDVKKYAESREAFRKALEMRQGDLYVINEIEKINRILNQEKGGQGESKLTEFNANRTGGEKALGNNKLSEGRIPFEQPVVGLEDHAKNVILEKPQKAKPVEISRQEKEILELENRYNPIIREADQLFKSGDYAKAKVVYAYAINILNRPWPNDQIARIELKEAEQSSATLNDKQPMTGQAETEKRQLEKQELEGKYNTLIQSADANFKAGNYIDAQADYMLAKGIINKPWPDEQLAKIKLKIAEQSKEALYEKQRLASQVEIEKREREKQELESKYNTAIQSADANFEAGNYRDAQADYIRAKTIIKKPWPDEQLVKIKLKIAEQSKETLKEKQRLASQAEAEKKEREKQELENRYNTVIQSADAHFQAGNYIDAQAEYIRAKSIIKKPWPDEQIAKIKLKIAEQSKEALHEKQRLASQAEAERKEREKQELESKYSAFIQSADAHFQAGSYKDAQADYTRAKSIIKKPWPDEQIGRINKILMEIAATENAEKMRIDREAKIAAQYNSLIQKAGIEFNKNNYIKARQYYTEAAALQPGEAYPSERLQVIQNELEMIATAAKGRADSNAAAAELRKKYDLAVSRAKSFYLKADFENAKIAYEEAMALKPSELNNKIQLEKINNRIIEIEKERAFNAQYDAIIAMADSLIIIKEYENARTAYNQAIKLRPRETYPVKQVRFIKKEIVVKAYTDSMAAVRAEIVKYNTILKKADIALTEKRFSDAISGYNDALKMNPSSETAIKGLQIASHQYEQQKEQYDQEQVQLKLSMIQPVQPAKKKSKRDKTIVVPKKEINPYTFAELIAKYPDINFAAFPAKQPFSKEAANMVEIQERVTKVLLEKPVLDLSATHQLVSLVCQGIFPANKNVILKFLIQNNAETDFLTGTMQLSWKPAAGTNVKIDPFFIYPGFLPVIKPGEEAIIEYVCKLNEVTDGDSLEFELSDRLEKVKLKLNIPGGVYKNQIKK